MRIKQKIHGLITGRGVARTARSTQRFPVIQIAGRLDDIAENPALAFHTPNPF